MSVRIWVGPVKIQTSISGWKEIVSSYNHYYSITGWFIECFNTKSIEISYFYMSFLSLKVLVGGGASRQISTILPASAVNQSLTSSEAALAWPAGSRRTGQRHSSGHTEYAPTPVTQERSQPGQHWQHLTTNSHMSKQRWFCKYWSLYIISSANVQ